MNLIKHVLSHESKYLENCASNFVAWFLPRLKKNLIDFETKINKRYDGSMVEQMISTQQSQVQIMSVLVLQDIHLVIAI